MTASWAAVSSAMAAASHLGMIASFRGNAVQSSTVALPTLRRCRLIRAEAEKDTLRTVQTDGSNNNVTESVVEKNMAGDLSEKSVSAAEPAPGALPRPETGDRSFGSIMAFDGPGPETMNGRLAMTGFVWALISEALTHKSIWQQITEPGNTGFFWLVVATNLIISASVVPLLKGESPDSRSSGLFTAQAERWNGRVAMIGYLGLLAYEFFAQKAFL